MKEKNLDELKLELEELNEKIEDKRLEKIQGRKKQFFDNTLNLEKILSDYIIDSIKI